MQSIHLILGEDGLLVSREEERLVADAFAGAPPGFNLATVSAEEGAPGAVETANTLPMMAKRRVVVVRHMQHANVELLEELLGYASNPNPSSVMILTGSKLPQKGPSRKLEARIKANGKVLRFKKGQADPVAFALEAAQGAGAKLDRSTARMLVELVGPDLGQLQAEVNKAANFVGASGVIDQNTIDEVTSLVGEAVVWELTDAILARNKDKALGVTHRLLESGDSPHRLLAMITWQVRQLLIVQEAIQNNQDPRSAGVRMPPRKLKQVEQNVRKRPIPAEQILGDLAEVNRAFHERKIGERRLFESLVQRLVR